MNNVNKCKMLLSSLSVFRGIMNRSVPKAFYELLLSLDKKPEEFLGAYGKLCSMLCERGCADKFAFAISETALFDDNCFARAATAGKQGELPENVVSAVKTDCDAILTAAKLTSDEVLEHIPMPMKSRSLFRFFQSGRQASALRALTDLTVHLTSFLLIIRKTVAECLPVTRHSSGVTVTFSLLSIQTRLIWIHLRDMSVREVRL